MRYYDRLNTDMFNRTECRRYMNINATLNNRISMPYEQITNRYKINNTDNIKYISQSGGANINNSVRDMETHNAITDNIYEYEVLKGGANNIFRNNSTIFLLADATDPVVINNIYARIAKLKISHNLLKGVRPHFSLMQIIVNTANPDHKILMFGKNINPHLRIVIDIQYNRITPQIYISSPKGGYEIMGDFFAKVYTQTNAEYITLFRKQIYKYIEGFLGKGQRRLAIVNNIKYFVYSYRGRDLLAVPEYYHGNGIWKPHLSIIKLDKIQKSNPKLYAQYLRYGISALVNALSGVKGSISTFNIRRHFGALRITVN